MRTQWKELLGLDASHPHSSSTVIISPFSSISSCRLSTHFTPNRPISSGQCISWVSLQGRIINAEVASSARSIKGGLNYEEVVAWELFNPIYRFLIVAVIGVAVSESKKNKLISRLSRSIKLRDQELSHMQKKLDNLYDQLNTVQSKCTNGANMPSPTKTISLISNDVFGNNICWDCQQHQEFYYTPKEKGDEVLPFKIPWRYDLEPEERRMSDLSDLASSVTSTAEVHVAENSELTTMEHDICTLKRECEEKNAVIKELTTALQLKEMARSKRIGELEDIIHSKEAIIESYKEDTIILEQKVTNLTRFVEPSKPSFSERWELPMLMDNIIYDMDSPTSHVEQEVVDLAGFVKPSEPSFSERWQLPMLMDNIVYDMDSPTSLSSSELNSSPSKKLSKAPSLEKFNTTVSSEPSFSPMNQLLISIESKDKSNYSLSKKLLKAPVLDKTNTTISSEPNLSLMKQLHVSIESKDLASPSKLIPSSEEVSSSLRRLEKRNTKKSETSPFRNIIRNEKSNTKRVGLRQRHLSAGPIDVSKTKNGILTTSISSPKKNRTQTTSVSSPKKSEVQATSISSPKNNGIRTTFSSSPKKNRIQTASVSSPKKRWT